MEFCNVIKALRRKNQMTQKQLAKMLRIDQSVVSAWELGKKMPQIEHLLKLSDIFAVSTDELLGRSISGATHKAELIEQARNISSGKLTIQELRLSEGLS